ncbi:hypothetical protein CANCADRAFT_15536, partial [Tortispora caseinolytica NRRL Y-17796]
EDEKETAYLIDTKSAVSYFRSSSLPDTQLLGIYTSVFPRSAIDDPFKYLKSQKSSPGHSVILFIGGGHFAGVVIKHDPKHTILAHRAFHRYTTRRKQGGSQSANDNAHGKAHSAGSNLRRYNEQALIQEVRDLLESWRAYIQSAQNIYIRAAGASNRKILIGYENAPIPNKDAKVRSVPFSTRRATMPEITRVWELLTSTIIADTATIQKQIKDKLDAQAARDFQDDKKLHEPGTDVTETKPKHEKSEMEVHTNQLISNVKRSRSSAIKLYLKSNRLSPNVILEPQELYHHTPTLLHYATSVGQKHVIRYLISNLHADLTIRNDSGQTAYQLASPTIKMFFRTLRFELGEEFTTWDAAHV